MSPDRPDSGAAFPGGQAPPRPDSAPASSAAALVRAPRPEELPRIWQLVLELASYERLRHLVSGTPEQLGRMLFGEPHQFEGLVAEHAGRIVGYALFYPCYSSFRTCTRLWLEDLYVEPGARGSGAGRALLSELARIALARGCDRVDWFVLDWNQLAIDFYERQGGGRVVADWVQYGLDETGLRRLAERE